MANILQQRCDFGVQQQNENVAPGGARKNRTTAIASHNALSQKYISHINTDVTGIESQKQRPVLGTITNQTNTRVQPHRAAKHQSLKTHSKSSVSESENIHPELLHNITETLLQKSTNNTEKSRNFSIFTDTQIQCTDAVSTNDPSSLVLNNAITSLTSLDTHVNRKPLAAIDINDSSSDRSTDSPMVLDTSVDVGSCRTSGFDRRLPAGVISIDDTNSVLLVPEYAEDICTYLKEAEIRHKPGIDYMRKQPDITPSMRCILVDWLVEVGEEYKLHTETLYLAVSYIDRFLSLMSVLRSKLQLVGTASMFLASKYEEIYPPDVSEFVYITDDTYTKKQVLRMEHLILKVLSFDLNVPTANVFLHRYLRAAHADNRLESLSKYVCEIALLDVDTFMKYSPSLIATASVCLANWTLNQKAMTPTLQHYSNYSYEDVRDCVADLHKSFIAAPDMPQQAIVDKYKHTKYMAVSSIPAPKCLPS